MLSKVVSSSIFKVFGMTRPGIEPRSPGPLANTLTAGPNTHTHTHTHIHTHIYIYIYMYIYVEMTDCGESDKMITISGMMDKSSLVVVIFHSFLSQELPQTKYFLFSFSNI